MLTIFLGHQCTKVRPYVVVCARRICKRAGVTQLLFSLLARNSKNSRYPS